jgi:peroxiredoxin
MASSNQSRLKVKELIPQFELKDLSGNEVVLWDFKEKNNLLLVFLQGQTCPHCTDFLHSISVNQDEFLEEQTVVLAIVRDNLHVAQGYRDELDAWMPILNDSTGAVTDQYSDILPAVFVTDRFQELRAEWVVGPKGSFPAQNEILDVLELMNLECPECGAPVDWKSKTCD